MTLTQVLCALFGLVAFELHLRWVATAKPNDRPGAPARRPWFGRDAAAAIRRRQPLRWLVPPLAACMYVVLSVTPPLPAGITAVQAMLVGVGLGAARQLVFWWILPFVLRVKDPTEPSIPNRILSLEQRSVQAIITHVFRNWEHAPPLAASQAEVPTILSPIRAVEEVTADAKTKVYTKVYTRDDPEVQAILAQTAQHCRYMIEEGDDLDAICDAASVAREEVAKLNPDLNWKPGVTVKLPRPLCLYLVERERSRIEKANRT
jgi:hypothetical protein